MIEVAGQYIAEDVEDILKTVKEVLAENNINRFSKIVDTPNNVQTNCPFHKGGQERKPSFGISKKDGACHCFACGWAGSLSEMVSNVFGYNDGGIYGSKWLIRNFLTVEVDERKDLNLDMSRTIKHTEQTYISEKELDKYRVYHPYMWKRKMTPEVVDIFDIGYDKDTQCLTFPIRDERGNCLFVARRSVNTKFFHYPNDVAKPVYGVYEYKHELERKYKVSREGDKIITITSDMYSAFDKQPVIICESMINAITCWVYGKYAVALNGTGTKQQIEQLKRMPNRKFILALDPDEAGERGREKLRKGLTNKIVTEYIIPKGKDINDLTEDEFNNLKEIFN